MNGNVFVIFFERYSCATVLQLDQGDNKSTDHQYE